jgi:FkbM family methyltransferase
MVDIAGNVHRVMLKANASVCHLIGRSAIRFRHRGILLDLPLGLMTPGIRHSFENNYYESAEERQIRAGVVRKGDTVLEIGSAVGFLTCVIGKTGLADRIVSVEANPLLTEIARHTCRINDVSADVRNGLVCWSVADGDKGELFVAEEFWAGSPLQVAGSGGRLTVPNLPLERLLDELRPTLLVIDIEGGEVELLRDARLDGVNRVMLELHQHLTGLEGVRSVFASLDREGFAYSQQLSASNIVTFERIG